MRTFAAVGNKRKREPEPVLDPAPEPYPEPADQGFYWEGLPLEFKKQVLEGVCTGTRVINHYPSGLRFAVHHTLDAALVLRSVSREFATLLREVHASVYENTGRRCSNTPRTYLIVRHLVNGEFRNVLRNRAGTRLLARGEMELL